MSACLALALWEEIWNSKSLTLLWATTFSIISFFKNWKRKPQQYSREHVLFSSPESITFSESLSAHLCMPVFIRSKMCSFLLSWVPDASWDSATNFLNESAKCSYFLFQLSLLSVLGIFPFSLLLFFNVNKLGVSYLYISASRAKD